MTTLQEYLNQKYPTPKTKAQVKTIKINSQNPLKKIEGGELVLKDFPNLQEVWKDYIKMKKCYSCGREWKNSGKGGGKILVINNKTYCSECQN